MPNVDANFTEEVIRRDDPNIIACARHQALFLGVRLAYDADGYPAGTVLAQNNVNDMFYAYDDGGSSGLDTAVAVLEKPIKATDFASETEDSVANSVLAPAIFRGTVFYDKLDNIDANGVTDLRGRVVTDVTGVDLLIFG